MLYKKKGYPEESEVVLCTVLKVHHNTVFTLLDEYEDKKGVIHISEISPGRIRNIRDFVVEGKKVICKVLRINEERGHIDLSLRRVTDSQKREKNSQLKQEQKAEKILEFVAKDLNMDIKNLYSTINESISKKYASLNEFFEKVVSDNSIIKDSGLDAKAAKKLEEAIKLRIKEAVVKIDGKLKLTSFEPNGMDVVKEALEKGQDTGKDKVMIKYLGGGSYSLSVTGSSYKEAEKMLKEVSETILSQIRASSGTGEFARAGA